MDQTHIKNQTGIVPKNYSNGKLIFNKYRPKDLVLLGCSIGISFLFIILYSFVFVWHPLALIPIVCIPALAFVLTTKLQHHHNILEILILNIKYIFKKKEYHGLIVNRKG